MEESRRALVPLLSVLIAVMFFLLGSLSDFWLRDHASELVRHNQRHRKAGRRTQLNSAPPRNLHEPRSTGLAARSRVLLVSRPMMLRALFLVPVGCILILPHDSANSAGHFFLQRTSLTLVVISALRGTPACPMLTFHCAQA